MVSTLSLPLFSSRSLFFPVRPPSASISLVVSLKMPSIPIPVPGKPAATDPLVMTELLTSS